MRRSSVFLGVSHAPIPRGGAPAFLILGTSYMRAHSMSNNHRILHGDQTRCEESFTRSTINADARSTILYYTTQICIAPSRHANQKR